jgi:hypothetical protein
LSASSTRATLPPCSARPAATPCAATTTPLPPSLRAEESRMIETTGLRTLENALRLIDPAILKQALENDDAQTDAAGPAD